MPSITIQGELSEALIQDPYVVYQLYNALDSAVTAQLLPAMKTQLNANTSRTYDREMRLQSLCLEMSREGFPVDRMALANHIDYLEKRASKALRILHLFCEAIGARPINPSSTTDVPWLFYTYLKLPPVEKYDRATKQRRISTDIEALEKLKTNYPFPAAPFVNAILAYRENRKLASVFKRGLEPITGNLRCNFSPSGTDTGRLSSQQNVYSRGTNAQNITNLSRQVVCAPPGYAILNFDLKTAESIAVGFTSRCRAYIDACLSGDVHTASCRLVWTDMPWTGDIKHDEELAKQKAYRMFSWRDLMKKGGHACVTGDHEVLTRVGWVRIDTVADEAEIATWAPSGTIQFEVPSNWVRKYNQGEMHEWNGTSLSLKMTHDHTVWTRLDQRSPYKKFPAGLGPRGYIPLGSGYVGGTVKVPARLIAAFQCDGTQKSAGVMEFNLKKDRKFDRLIALCRQYGIDFTIAVDGRVRVKGALPKKAGAYMLDWTADSLSDFIDEYKYWDGHIAETSVSLSASDYIQLEWLQTLGRLVGVGGNIDKGHRTGFSNKLNFRLQQNNRQYAAASSLKTKVTNEACYVYCPTVTTGAFLVRRNGKICVTGNTNYYGQPRTLQAVAFLGQATIEFVTEFQHKYFAAFPEIREWHLRVIARLQQTGIITTALGRERRFWGRSDDTATHRAAIAFDPQSIVADVMNEGLMQTQSWLLKECRDARTFIGSARNKCLYPLRANLRAQVHDAGVFLIPIEAIEELAPRIKDKLIYPVDFGDLGIMRIPTDMELGKTWMKLPEDKAEITNKWEAGGLRGYRPGDDLGWLADY